MSFKHWISNLHYRQGKRLSPWLWPFLPLSYLYRLAVAVRIRAYRLDVLKTAEPTVPVISVGNLTTGGTGKTPIVVELARGLIAAGQTVVILSRGYGAVEPVPYARALDPRHGDEAYLIQSEVPEAMVIVGRDRVRTLNKAIQDYHPDFVLLDDGFQYLPLQRHLNILLVDGKHLFGNGHLLPAGPLREPLSALQRADLVLVTKQVDTDAMRAVERHVAQYGGKVKPTVLPVPFQPTGLKTGQNPLSLNALKDRPVLAFSGIAQPEQFEQDLQRLGAQIIQHCRFQDHHVYTDADVSRLVGILERHSDVTAQDHPWLVTTEKDFVKIATLIPTAWQPFLAVLQVAPALDGKWFYTEFITPMLRKTPARSVDVH